MEIVSVAKRKNINIDNLQYQEVALTRDQAVISDDFVNEHITLIQAVASNVSSGTKLPTGLTFGDLVNYGVEGLIKAKSKFDESKGTQFKTYAFYRIRGEILDSIRREWSYRNPQDYQHHKKRIEDRIAQVTQDSIMPKAGEHQMSVGDLISNSAMAYLISLEDVDEVISSASKASDLAEEVLDQVDLELYRSVLLEEVQALESEEKTIIKLFYFEDMKQKDIAEKLKMSKSKVCRVHMKLLEKLRRRLERRLSPD